MRGCNSILKKSKILVFLLVFVLGSLLINAETEKKWSEWSGGTDFFGGMMVKIPDLEGIYIVSEGEYYFFDEGMSLLHKRSTLPIPEDSKHIDNIKDNDGNIYAAGRTSLYVSIDGGNKWEIIPTQNYPRYIRKIAVDEKGKLFASNNQSIFYLEENSHDWIPIFENSSVEDFIVIGREIFVATYGFKVYKSIDTGDSWEETGNGFRFPSTPYKMVSDKFGNLYVGTYWDGVFKTTDKGKNWFKVNNGLPENRGVSSLLHANGIIYALIKDQRSGVGVFKSDNGGNTWANISLNLSVWTFNEALDLIVTQSGSLFLLTQYRGIFYLPMGSHEWVNINEEYSLQPYQVEQLDFDSDGVIYAILGGRGSAPGASWGILKSEDDGNTWIDIGDGIEARYMTIKDIAIDSNDHLYVSIYGQEIFKSTDAGESWVLTGSSYNEDIDIMEETGNGFRFPSTPGVLTVDSKDIVYAGTYWDGVFISSDRGETWVSKNEGLPKSSGVSVITTSSNKVYAVLSDQRGYGGLYYTDNECETWSKLSNAPTGIQSLFSFETKDLIVGTSDGAYKSDDGGKTWRQIKELSGYFVNCFASFNNDNTIFAGTSEGVYVHEKSQGGWHLIPKKGLTDSNIRSIAVQPTGVVITGTKKGVFSTYAINAYIPVSKVSLSKTNLVMYVGEFQTLQATLSPNNATQKNLSWESNNPAVVTVDKNGKIIAHDVGEAVITVVTECGGKKATCSINIPYIAPEMLQLNESEYILYAQGVKSKVFLRATVLPLNTSYKSVKWLSEDEEIARVENGLVVAGIKEGSVKIIAETLDGGIEAHCEITVIDDGILYGDANGDNVIDVKDAIKILRHIVGISQISEENLQAAKVTDSYDKLSIRDAIKILRYIVGLY